MERLSLMLGEARLVEGGEDSWIWKQDRTGNYLVKSSYLALCDSNFFPNCDDSMLNTLADIWRLKVPPKSNLFLWRLMRNRLPSGDNLARRNIVVDEGVLKCVLRQN